MNKYTGKNGVEENTSNTRVRYTLQIHILVVYFILSISVFTIIRQFNYRANTKANIELGQFFLKHINNSLIEKINITFSDAQVFSNFGAKTYNHEEEVNKENMVLVGMMMEMLSNYPYLTSVYTGTKSGKFLQVMHINSNDSYRSDKSKMLPARVVFAVRYIDLSLAKATEIWVYEDQNKWIIDKETVVKPTYDHRNRGWYQATEKRQTATWSNIYIDSVTKAPCITIANPVYDDATGEFIGIFALDTSTIQLSDFLKKANIGDKSSIFILSSKGEVIAHSDVTKTVKVNNDSVEIALVANIDDSNLKEAYRLFEGDKSPIFTFQNKGITYIAAFSSFPRIVTKEANGHIIINDSLSKDWTIGVIVPADEFVGGIKATQQKNFLVGFAFLIFGMLIMSFFLRRIAKPIVLLTEEADKIRNFDLTGTLEVKSSIRELKVLNDVIVSMRYSMRAFSKFIPKVLVGKLLKSNQEIRVGGRSQLTTFLFTDIEGFTAICETYPPAKLSVHLSEYFEEVTKIIFMYNGLIDKYIGDAVMAFWGAPVRDKEQALHACQAALAIQKRLANLNQQWASQEKPVFNTRIGVHIGEAIVGNMGSSERINYTALGDTVNIAARLEGANKFYHTNIIISEDTMQQIKDNCLVRPLDIVAVKGRSEGIQIYELVGITHGEHSLFPSTQQISFCAIFTKGYQLYKERRWEDAIQVFQSIQQKLEEDHMVGVYIKRCKEFKKNPPPADWNGIFVLAEK